MYFIDDFQFSVCPAEHDPQEKTLRNDFFDYQYHVLCDKAEELSMTKRLRAYLTQPYDVQDYGY